MRASRRHQGEVKASDFNRLVGHWINETRSMADHRSASASPDFPQLCWRSRVMAEICQGNVMGNSGVTDVDRLANSPTDAPKICGAMAEQRRPDGWSENESVPQQFVHLIGCRDPGARRSPFPLAQAVHPRLASSKS
jgi:hypothetical protein